MKRVINKARTYLLANFRDNWVKCPSAAYEYYLHLCCGPDQVIVSRNEYVKMIAEIALEKGLEDMLPDYAKEIGGIL